MKKKSKPQTSLFGTHTLVWMAVFSAIACVLSYFPHLHVFPTLLTEIEFSDVPVLIAGYYLHPVCGIIVALIKSLLHLPMTETGCIGEVLTFVQAVVCLIPMWFFRKEQTRADLIAKLVCGAVLDVGYGALAGVTVIVPLVLGKISTISVGLVTVFYLIRALVVTSVTVALSMSLHTTIVRLAPHLHLSKRSQA